MTKNKFTKAGRTKINTAYTEAVPTVPFRYVMPEVTVFIASLVADPTIGTVFDVRNLIPLRERLSLLDANTPLKAISARRNVKIKTVIDIKFFFRLFVIPRGVAVGQIFSVIKKANSNVVSGDK